MRSVYASRAPTVQFAESARAHAPTWERNHQNLPRTAAEVGPTIQLTAGPGLSLLGASRYVTSPPMTSAPPP
jgi:hypothetical protein